MALNSNSGKALVNMVLAGLILTLIRLMNRKEKSEAVRHQLGALHPR